MSALPPKADIGPRNRVRALANTELLTRGGPPLPSRRFMLLQWHPRTSTVLTALLPNVLIALPHSQQIGLASW